MNRSSYFSAIIFLGIGLVAAPSATEANVIWEGDFETGDLLQWHRTSDTSTPWIWGVPEYCRPEGYEPPIGGDGSCLSLQTDTVRHGNYAVKFTVKNATNGSEPRDCDGDWCDRRRSQLSNFATLPEFYDALPYRSERWVSYSIYIPEDWEPADGGWGPVLFGMKAYNPGAPGIANILIEDGSWKIRHRWSPDKDPKSKDQPWQYGMFYTKDYPVIGESPKWDDGVKDFPDPKESRQALASINRGGWTDWVLHIKYDARGAGQGGEGFLRYYKREDDGPWTQVVDIRPGEIERGGMTFDRGIGYNASGGFGMAIGMYMSKEVAWDAPNNLSLYFDNIRIGDENASLSEMAPDGAGEAALAPPVSPNNLVTH